MGNYWHLSRVVQPPVETHTQAEKYFTITLKVNIIEKAPTSQSSGNLHELYV